MENVNGMRIVVDTFTATAETSTITSSSIVLVPFQDTMRIVLGSIAATSGTFTTTALTIGIVP